MARFRPDIASEQWVKLRICLAATMLASGLSLHAAFADTQTITFDSLSDEVTGELDGQYPTGLIEWGSGTWYLSGPWQALQNKSISFNGEGITSATFTFVSQPRQLVSIQAYNGDQNPGTVTLSCSGQSGQSDQQVQLNSEEIRTINTGWTAPCSSVTITTSNGWQTNFENLVIQ